MSVDNVTNLPIWKKGDTLTPYDRLSELALVAREHPERFHEFILVYRETLKNGNWQIRTMEYGGDLGSRLGLLTLGQNRLIEDSQK